MRFVHITTLLLFIALSGCATVARGSHDTMAISTEPPNAVVSTDQETKASKKARKKNPDIPVQYYGCAATPCEFQAPRKSEFIMTITKEGYEPVEIGVDNGIHKESLNANLAGSAGVGVAAGVGLGIAVSSITTVGTGTAVGAGAATAAVVALPLVLTSLIVDGSSGALYSLRPNPVTLVLPPDGTEFKPHPKVKAIREKRAKKAAKKNKKVSE
ncbi:hypothetical protein N9W89_05910 [Hellea sp.]|nr:hypothetical protein [Hellea sp.]